MAFQISALPFEPFAPLFAMSDDELSAINAKRCVATRTPGFPCRVSLRDAAVGESVILVPFTHQPASSPYRGTGPVFVRADAIRETPDIDVVPELLRRRILSLRAYGRDGLMVNAAVVDGREIEAGIDRLFADEHTAYLHVHYAGPGCYACRVDRG